MTPSDFTAWQHRMGWNNKQAARALYGDNDGGQIRGFHSGARKVTKRVEYLCWMIEAVLKEDDLAMGRIVREVRERAVGVGPRLTRGGDRKSVRFREQVGAR